jgi:hypothetical protein
MGNKKLIYILLLIGTRNDIAEKIVKSGLRMGYDGGKVPWRFHLSYPMPKQLKITG